MGTPLSAGLNTVINQKVGSTSTPLYPFTKTANVVDASGNDLDTIIAGLAPLNHGNHVPTTEVANNLKFLRNDNSWALIQDASTSQKGVVQLSSALNVNDNTLAATASAAKALKDAIDAIDTGLSGYIPTREKGAASGVAELDSTGKVPAAQLPSFVDDIVEGYLHNGTFYTTKTPGDPDPTYSGEITPETGKIYVDLDTDKTYRWSGSVYVEISPSLALGETSSTAYRGDYGKIAYEHSQAAHARVDATKTEASENNGYIKINGAETLVYTHPTGTSATNPHGTTKEDLGLGNVENKSSATIRSELTASDVTTALSYTPQNASTLASAANNGVMSSTYAAKLDGCKEVAVNQTAPTFQGEGIWFQVIPDVEPEEPEP